MSIAIFHFGSHLSPSPPRRLVNCPGEVCDPFAHSSPDSAFGSVYPRFHTYDLSSLRQLVPNKSVRTTLGTPTMPSAAKKAPANNRFTGLHRYDGSDSAAPSTPVTAVRSTQTVGRTPQVSRAVHLGIGLASSSGGAGKGKGGKGLGKAPLGTGYRRHKKIARDSIRGISKNDIRRIARRGGVKRMSATIYDDIRAAMKARLEVILHDVVAIVEHTKRVTVTTTDVVFALHRRGNPIYGFSS